MFAMERGPAPPGHSVDGMADGSKPLTMPLWPYQSASSIAVCMSCEGRGAKGKGCGWWEGGGGGRRSDCNAMLMPMDGLSQAREHWQLKR